MGEGVKEQKASVQTTATIRAAVCQECGMPLAGWDERHPIGACEMFRRTRDADAVRESFAMKGVHHDG